MMFSPWVILGVILAVSSSYFLGHYRGYNEGYDTRDREMQVEIAKKNEEARQKEQAASETLSKTSTQLRKTQNALSQKQSDINALIDAGKLRLPVPQASTPSCVQVPGDTPAPVGNSAEANPEPERQVIKDIVAIASDGDKNTTQLNACIDAYEAIRNKFNAIQ